VIDRDGRIAEDGVNVACEETVGLSEDELVGRRFVDVFVPPEDQAEAAHRLERAGRAGTPVEHESQWLGRGGERLWVAWSCRPLLGESEASFYLICGTDVTEHKRQEAELRASRSRIVEAADLERSRLERNLHDGAQQRLVTLSLTLRLVESRLGRDSDAANLLAGAREELARALEDLRDLARGLHPAVLSDHGLRAALDALAARVPVPVRIDAAVRVRLPQPVEVAAYYVVSESLANVQKYARATEVTIGVEQRNGHTIVEVRDDGVGGAEAGNGSGLRGLADRVEALGGRLEVDSPVGAGTTVRAVIPPA
jgi:PAS domain S-box-containing protein